MFLSDKGPIRIKVLIFDLDNTLYPASSKLAEEMHRRMGVYVAHFLGVHADEADRLRHEGFLRHGTTLRWLQVEKGHTNPEHFLDEVHPSNLSEYLHPDPALALMLKALPYPKYILTNAPRNHALRVLDYLEIKDCFLQVFDLASNHYQGKPAASAYLRLLETLDIQASEAVFIDDVPAYLDGFAALGGHCVYIGEPREGVNYQRIEKIHELSRLFT